MNIIKGFNMDLDTLKNIINEYTGIPATQIDGSLTLDNKSGLDSFGLVAMIVDIENKFNITIPDEQLNCFKKLQDLIEYINKKV